MADFFAGTEADVPAAMRSATPILAFDLPEDRASVNEDQKQGPVLPSAFVTRTSLRSFPGAAVAVGAISTAARMLFPLHGGSPWVTLGAAFFVASLITLPTVFGPRFHFTPSEKLEAIGIAFLNSILLFLAVLGVPVLVGALGGRGH